MNFQLLRSYIIVSVKNHYSQSMSAITNTPNNLLLHGREVYV